MIVCSCNVLSDRAVRAVAGRNGEGATRLSDVFCGLGCRPQCGRCAATLRKILREAVDPWGATCPALLDSVPAEPLPLAAE